MNEEINKQQKLDQDKKRKIAIFSLFGLSVIIMAYFFMTQTMQVNNPNSFLAQTISSNATSNGTKVDGVCDAPHPTYTFTACNPGDAINIIASRYPDYTDRWDCRGYNGGATVNCTNPIITNGKCGANRTCSTGRFAPITDEYGNIKKNWMCLGVNQGSAAICP